MNTIQMSQRFSSIERQIAEIKEVLIKGGLLELPPEQPRPAELPLVNAQVTMRVRPSIRHPFTVLANFDCPACNLKHDQVEFFIAENGGTTVTACSCGQNLRVKLAWDVGMK